VAGRPELKARAGVRAADLAAPEAADEDRCRR
jgi:hypothetical protein